jgi:hypothetical protein
MQYYPSYLYNADARLIDPATSAIALTVGSLSYGEGEYGLASQERVGGSVARHREWPSPFTRTGFGLNGAVKPEVVEYGGDLRFISGSIAERPLSAGVPTLGAEYSPPEGRLFATRSGTSLAAPRVANLAAKLAREFPGASSNLIRALIIASARVPDWRPPSLIREVDEGSRVMSIYGYGRPEFKRARWSLNREVMLLHDGVIGVDAFELFLLPPLPPSFIAANGIGSLAVSLAFDPPTRHTRLDSYLGIGMEFVLFRNVEPMHIADVLRHWNRDEKEDLGGLDIPTRGSLRAVGMGPIQVPLLPAVNLRKRGTAQKGVLKIKNRNWQYDSGSMVLAVICERKWAPAEIQEQRYAVVVSLGHSSQEVNLYEEISQHARVYERIRVRA